jgi:nucleoside-diphosphate-sugar epimerase/lipopolysaccharide biosynthesis glycosyltransferase/predicted O-methyltransferase YrrM
MEFHSTKPSCEKEYIFTVSQDWLSVHLPVWVDKLLPHRHRVLASRGYIRILEIGSWEGRSAVWFLTQMCSGDSEQNCLVCVDHFDCGNSIAGQDRLKRMEYNINTTQLRSRARILKLFSVPALTQLSKEGEGFDVIYIDGSHRSDDTFLDAELAFRLANEGAIMVFDDYEWNVHSTASMEHPKRGIDAFLLLHSDEVTVLHKGYQILLMKATTPRLGFSWPLSEQAERLAALTDFDERKEKIETSLKELQKVGPERAYVALAFDTTFAVAAAVAISSLLDHATIPISLFIGDLGILEEDLSHLHCLLSTHPAVDMRVVQVDNPQDLPHSFARLQLMAVLPVERLLYLDADILVRHDIGPLWCTHLRGLPLGAVIDFGFPRGHQELVEVGAAAVDINWCPSRDSYFNAGVLLLDLTLLRPHLQEWLAFASTRGRSMPYMDQDVLNLWMHSMGGWHPLDRRWNVQGAYSYAAHRVHPDGPFRPALFSSLHEVEVLLKEACIVHFTGPVCPLPSSLLCGDTGAPFKPWGYWGSLQRTSLPLVGRWWQVLEQTPWKGFQVDMRQHVWGALLAETVAFLNVLKAAGLDVLPGTQRVVDCFRSLALRPTLQGFRLPLFPFVGSEGTNRRCPSAEALGGTTHVPWPDEIKHVSCAMQQPLSGTVGTDDALLDPSLLVEHQVMGQCVRDDGGLPTRGPLVVTGGAGFIGSHVVEQARATGCYSCVTVVDSFCRGSYSNLEGVVPVVEADLTSLADSISALQGADTVIHAAACVGGSQFVLGGGEYDVQATTQRIDQNVLEACIMSGVRCLVYITTACSYPEAVQASYDPADSALNEHHICRCGASPPESGYGLAKLCGENMGLALAKQGLLDFRMVRLHNVYGPRMALDGTAQVVPALIRRAIQTPQDEVLKVAGSGQQFRDFLYVADAAAAVLLAASEDHYPSVVPFGSGQAVRFFLLLTRLCSLFHQCSSPGYRSWRNKSHLFLNSHTVALNLIWRCQKVIRGGPVIHLRQLTWDGSQEYPCMKDSF